MAELLTDLWHRFCDSGPPLATGLHLCFFQGPPHFPCIPAIHVIPLLLAVVQPSVVPVRPHGLQHARLPCPSLTPGVCSHFRPSSRWCALTSAAECCVHSGPAVSFLLELLVTAFCSSPGANETFQPSGAHPPCHPLDRFTLFTGLSWQEHWSRLLFLPPAGHVLSELFTLTHRSWVALPSKAHSFAELCKPAGHIKAVVHEVAPCSGDADHTACHTHGPLLWSTSTPPSPD